DRLGFVSGNKHALNRAVPRKTLEHFLTVFHVEFQNFFDVHAPAQAGGDDRAGAGAGKEIEMISQHERWRSCVGAKHFLHAQKNLQAENAPDSTAIQREYSFHRFIFAAAFDFGSVTATQSLQPATLFQLASPCAIKSARCAPTRSVYPTPQASHAIPGNVRAGGASHSQSEVRPQPWRSERKRFPQRRCPSASFRICFSTNTMPATSTSWRITRQQPPA